MWGYVEAILVQTAGKMLFPSFLKWLAAVIFLWKEINTPEKCPPYRENRKKVIFVRCLSNTTENCKKNTKFKKKKIINNQSPTDHYPDSLKSCNNNLKNNGSNTKINANISTYLWAGIVQVWTGKVSSFLISLQCNYLNPSENVLLLVPHALENKVSAVCTYTGRAITCRQIVL